MQAEQTPVRTTSAVSPALLGTWAEFDTDCEACWPPGPLQAFSLRMAGHGMSVSSAMMLNDRRYALEQLAMAHCLNDDPLRELATALFRYFERRQSGLPRMGFRQA